MKTKNLFFTLLMSALIIGFTSCNKDEEKGPAKEIAGSYEGVITSGNFPLTGNDVIVKVAYVSENQVNITLKDTITDLPVDIKCNANVTADTTDPTKFTISGGAATFKYQIPGAPAGTLAVDIPVTVNGTAIAIGVAGIASAKGINLDIIVGNAEIAAAIPGGPFPLSVVYNGTEL
ncbi:hypothetical protein FACS1894162_0100 [Bacteroidia bacterium]|nr:hypothetical protein FACS1894162_0100 [Bacteroidia bacterium]